MFLAFAFYMENVMGECNAAYAFLYGKGTKHEILRGTR